MSKLKETLDGIYTRFNRPEYIHPDPLEFLYHYEHPRDIEIVGLVASSLAYGRVAQILKNVSRVLDVMGPSPFDYLVSSSRHSLERDFAGFRHRFTSGSDIAALLWGARGLIAEYGSLNACFVTGLRPEDETVLPAMTKFVEEMEKRAGCRLDFILPSPKRKSACKRLNLFIRWMVRRDNVDPGIWSGIPSSKLIVPMDTHMHRICRRLGFTQRRQADLCAALEATKAFSRISPEDPVKYDFALTRPSIADIPAPELPMAEGEGFEPPDPKRVW